MKKNLLALAALTALSGVASAQSSVTLYGRVDLSVGRNLGSDQKVMQNGSGSRLGLRGSEDLGGGMKAIFNIETRFDADTGVAQQGTSTTAFTRTGSTTASVNRFWSARSLVGLEGGFGQVTFGREYTTAFLGTQLRADPWGWDTVANQAGITGLGIAKVRNDSAMTYKIGAAGFSFGLQVAEATDAIHNFDTKPVNLNIGYGAGPFDASVGYEKTGRVNEKMTSIQASYKFGAIKPGFYYGKGTMVNNDTRKGMMFTLTAPVGAGEVRASYGTLDNDSSVAARNGTVSKRLGLGYHYSMSKRTTLYADFARESAAKAFVGAAVDANRTAYDFGIKHNF